MGSPELTSTVGRVPWIARITWWCVLRFGASAAMVALLVTSSNAAGAPVLPPESEVPFRAALKAVNQDEKLGPGILLNSVSIDKDVVRLTIVLDGSEQHTVVLINAREGTGTPVGRWFQVAQPPQSDRMTTVLPRLGAVFDEYFSRSPWVDVAPRPRAAPDGPAPERMRSELPTAPHRDERFRSLSRGTRVGAFWLFVFVATIAWAFFSLRRPPKKHSAAASDNREPRA
jgi:hypothetical protein